MNAELEYAFDSFVQLTRHLTDEDLEKPWSWRDYTSEGVRFAFFRTYETLQEMAVQLALERSLNGPLLTGAQRILGSYHRAYRDLEAVLLRVPLDRADEPPAETEWSTRRTLAHILAGDMEFYGVVRYALERGRNSGDDRPEKVPEEAWDSMLGMNEEQHRILLDGSFESLVSYHQKFHQKVLREFASIQESELEWPATYWEEEPYPLRFRLHRFDSHMRQHTVQIEKTLDTLDVPETEALQLLRRIYGALAEVGCVTLRAPEVGIVQQTAVARLIQERVAELAKVLEG